MTQDEIDILWQQAMQESTKDGEVYIRYHFAKLVADKAFQNGYEKGVAAFNDAVLLERETCARICDEWPNGRDDIWEIGNAIRARGEQA